MRYIKLFENFINEHHLGLEQTSSLSKQEYVSMWSEYQKHQVDYLKSKGLSQEVIKYWTRPDTKEEHQENIQLPWFYNEMITKKFKFKFEEGYFNVKEFYPYISKKTREERERKWKDAIENGTEFFKGQKVLGNTPEERKKFLEESSRDYFNKMSKEKNKSKPICVEEPYNMKAKWIIVDGGHRLWTLEKLFPEGIILHMVKVTEEKSKNIKKK